MADCDNCGEPLVAHRCVHMIPCCPGKCPGPGDGAPAAPVTLVVQIDAIQWPAFVEEAEHRGMQPGDLVRTLIDRFLRSRHGV